MSLFVKLISSYYQTYKQALTQLVLDWPLMFTS